MNNKTLKYDVVIFCGGTSGCSCAYNCAKQGLKTLLIEKRNHLGGLMTSGLVVPVMKSSVDNLNCDYYKKIIVYNLLVCYNKTMLKKFKSFGFNLNETQLNQFEKYFELLVEYNQKFNITAITERDEVIYKHFIDSALGVEMFKCSKLIDIGSGGGFPAIPLKILLPSLSITLMDATEKKCEFLKRVTHQKSSPIFVRVAQY